MGRVLDPLLCVFLADIQSVGIGACMHVCVWYTELTCISNGVSKTDIVVGKVQCVCVCVDRWRGHSRCRAPLTTGVDIYPKVLPSAYCVLLAGPLPLQRALNHWGRYLPQGPTICILCASGTHTHWTLPTTMSVLETPLQGALNHWGRILPQGPTIQNNQLKKECV